MTDTIQQHERSPPAYRRIGQGFCGTVWASEEDTVAVKREDGGPGRSVLTDHKMHNLVLGASLQKDMKVNVCIPRWPTFIAHDDSWWNMNLHRFPKNYAACNALCSERIPPLSKPGRECLIDHYCPATSASIIKANDADRDCLARVYLGRRKIQNQARNGRNFFSLRNYPLHLNQAEELKLDVAGYACAMAEMLALMHWTAKIDANDVEFVLGGSQGTGVAEHDSADLGVHSLWVLDFDCCRSLSMDEAGIDQAARAFLKNDPYFPRPVAQGSRDHGLWLVFRNHYLECSRSRVTTAYFGLPEEFLVRVEELYEQDIAKRAPAQV